MPRGLKEFAFSDWMRMRPFTETLKVARQRLINRRYCLQPSRSGEVVSLGKSLCGRRVLITIAFNDPEVIALQIKLLHQTIDNFVHVVADNSADDQAADSIEGICVGENSHYVRLPDNPWQGRRHASRSHGQAMNWVWRQLLVSHQPMVFGFIDHDLFPTRRCDPFAPLMQYPFYGDKRWAGDRWFLWAGYCFFRFSSVAHLPLDFGQDWFLGLDTGGANWDQLYRNCNPSLLPDRCIYEQAILPGVSKSDAYVEWRDAWLHEVGLAGKLSLRIAKRVAVKQLLEDMSNQPSIGMV